MQLITDKPCLASLRCGKWALIKQVYPNTTFGLTGFILDRLPTKEDMFYRGAEHFYRAWTCDGHIYQDKEDDYDIIAVQPFPREELQQRVDQLENDLKIVTKKEAITRAYCMELRALAAEIVPTDDKEAFDKLYALATRPL